MVHLHLFLIMYIMIKMVLEWLMIIKKNKIIFAYTKEVFPAIKE